MGGTNNKPGKAKGKAKPAKKQSSSSSTTSTSTKERPKTRNNAITSEDLSADADFFSSLNTLPADLQQVLLNIFKHGLSSSPSSSDFSSSSSKKESGEGNEDSNNKPTEGDINAQIQQLKTHLYNRDFASAFTDATPSLLRVYALRWSASRSLAYCGLFKAVLLLESRCGSSQPHQRDDSHLEKNINALCIGGGAGAEIVALAGAWRLIRGDEGEKTASSSSNNNNNNNNNNNTDQQSASSSSVQAIEALSLENSAVTLDEKATIRKMSITAVDIAEWSDVVDRLAEAIQSPEVPGKKSYATPLIRNSEDHKFIDIKFRKLDVLTLSEENLRSLVLDKQVISLMFTLNELFSTSISKTTQLLLKITDFTNPGTILMVVDSPGSYSTLLFSKDGTSTQPQQQQQRQYPMKFLLDHALINVAEGKWEKIVAEDSRWFRKDASHKLQYNVDLDGRQGYIKLEDMRFQIHVYRRLPSPKGMELPR